MTIAATTLRWNRLPLRGLGLLVALALSGGCSLRPFDEWDPYNDSVLNSLRDFESRELLEEIDRLEAHGAELRLRDIASPPGFHAHLGYLHFLAGNGDAAVRHFEEEKARFPESAVFVDGLLERIE